MSMITFKTTVCGVCGRKRVELDLASSNIMDGMDLDTRPGEMYRSTMDTWIQECKDCGYVSANLSNGKPEYRTFLESDEVEAIAYARKRNGLTNDGAESKEITMEDESLKNIKKILCEYDKALTLLDQYDHQNMIRPAGNKSVHSVDYDECKKAIGYMKNNAYTVSDLFGNEKDDSFKSSIANIEQSFNGEEIYKSLEEKAAHLLYFVTKNHSFFDGNKRIAAAMFLYYLNKNDRLFSFGKKRIDDATLAALTVMIAESRPEEMEMMISMVVNCLYIL